MANQVQVKSHRQPPDDPPPDYQDADLWFTIQYEFTCNGITYYAWSYESKPDTINIPHYYEGDRHHSFDFIPYRDKTFCRIARYLLNTMNFRHVIVWCANRPIEVERQRLKH